MATKLTLNPRKVMLILASITLILVVASIMGKIMSYSAPWDRAAVRYDKKFSVDFEMTIPTYFNAFILLFAGVLLTGIAALKQKAQDRYTVHWFVLAIIFWYMSLDETISLHEFLIKPLRELFNPTGLLYFSWVIVAIPLLALLAIFYIRFLLSLPFRTRLEFLAAGTIYVTSAVGLEMVGGWYFQQFGEKQIPYIALTTLEETLEMTGILIFIHALLNYLCEFFPEIQLAIQDSPRPFKASSR